MYEMFKKHSHLKKYFDNFVAHAGEEDKSPHIQEKKVKNAKFSKNENLELKPYYLDRDRVQSRLFTELHSSQTKNIDWKNLEKMSKEAIGRAEMTELKLHSLLKVLTNEIVRLKKLDEKHEKELSKKPSKDKKDEADRAKISARKEIGLQRSRKLKIVKDEVERLIKVKEAEKKAPSGVPVDPKKQIFISKLNLDPTPRKSGKDGVEEPPMHEGHLKNLRKKDYYENRVKKAFQGDKTNRS